MSQTWHSRWCDSRGIVANTARFDFLVEQINQATGPIVHVGIADFLFLIDHLVATGRMVVPKGDGVNLGNGKEVVGV